MSNGVGDAQQRFLEQMHAELRRIENERQGLRTVIAQMQAQLAALDADHAVRSRVVASGRTILGHAREGAPTGAIRGATSIPPARCHSEAKPTEAQSGDGSGPSAADRVADAAGQPAPVKGSATPIRGAEPTLVERMRQLMDRQTEPRTAAECAQELGVGTERARAALNGLLRVGRVTRHQQQRTVYYDAVRPEDASHNAEATAWDGSPAVDKNVLPAAAGRGQSRKADVQRRGASPVASRIASGSAVPTVSDRVRQALQARAVPQSAEQITVEVHGADADATAINRIRTALDRLVARQVAEKIHLGKRRVAYQATGGTRSGRSGGSEERAPRGAPE
ncbi:hypothetical protein BIV57_01005 [Mangrovactinospora gilvigrisea]|uniref:Uncharacterized protein n=1 Tax=Mangrovactinospora gilvigrisea TaxID=1428644 RepID=A0A1J7BLG5_9ACTN|nr:hypothetical protein [Mangrovactinospora gilvigrisea]OIV39445.1 hypothetical protein BIV57_01005 [Mangrovactinospora gilvigrisea]